MTRRPEFLPYCLTGLCLAAVVVLLLAGRSVPDGVYALLALAGGASLALTRSGDERRGPRRTDPK